MNTIRNRSILFLLCLTIHLTGFSKSRITSEELHKHIQFLTSDSIEGRYPGTRGDVLSAKYIADEFKKYGLKVFKSDYLQTFEVISRVEPGKNNAFIFNDKTYEIGKDFLPFSFSENTQLNANVIFAGFGFKINTPHLVWNDYAHQNVDQKWVMILRGHPDDERLNNFYKKFSSDRDKAMQAKDMGAAGVLLVSGPGYSGEDKLEKMGRRISTTGIPVIQISRKLANEILAGSNRSIEELEKDLVSNRQSVSFDTDVEIKAQSELNIVKAETYNVIGLLEGNHPQLKNEYIIIGGHYDHLGWGGPFTSSRYKKGKAIHPGADDNASGTAAILEIAEKFAAHRKKLDRSILFIAFGAEEMGLIGSSHFVRESDLNDENISVMLNLDMVGRLSHNKTIEVSGVGTAMELEALLKKYTRKHDFNLHPYYQGYGPSDHSSFYSINVPVLSFTTGVYSDYHTPEDKIENINFEGLKLVSDMIFDLVRDINTMDKQLSFKESGKPRGQKVSRRSLGVTLGIMPEVNSSSEEGLRAKFVVEGKPAKDGGMQNGDLIVSIDEKEIKNIDDYMYRLSKLKKGQKIKVKVIRKGEPLVLTIQL